MRRKIAVCDCPDCTRIAARDWLLESLKLIFFASAAVILVVALRVF